MACDMVFPYRLAGTAIVETVEAMQKLHLRSTALQGSLLRKTQGEYCWKDYTVDFEKVIWALTLP